MEEKLSYNVFENTLGKKVTGLNSKTLALPRNQTKTVIENFYVYWMNYIKLKACKGYKSSTESSAPKEKNLSYHEALDTVT